MMCGMHAAEHGVTVRHMSTMAKVHSTGTMRTIAGPDGRLRAISSRFCVAISSVRALVPQIWPTEAISLDKSYVWAHSIVVYHTRPRPAVLLACNTQRRAKTWEWKLP